MPTAPYPNLEECVEAARIKVNDAIIPGGQTLQDTRDFTLPIINLGWRRAQQILVNMGFVTLESELVLTLAGVSTLDPAVQVSLSWSGYNNGSGLNAAVVLPQNMIRPLKMWERISGSTTANPISFDEMDLVLDGLAMGPKLNWNQQWEWRQDKIQMPGARSNTDVRIKIAAYLPDFVDAGTTPFASQAVEILRSQNMLTCFIAYEFCNARGDTDAGSLLTDGQNEAAKIAGVEMIETSHAEKESERGKMADRYSKA